MEFREKIAQNLRLIWAIAAKDIGDAIKNRTTISIIIGVAFLMLSGQAMPLLLKLRAVPRAYYYDTGGSNLVPDLAKNDDFQLIKMPSREELEKVIGESSNAVLGLLIPSDFDQIVDAGKSIELVGMAVHWIKAEDVEETASYFERRLSEQTGVPLEINLEGNTIYPGPDADGQPFMVTLSLVVATITIGAFLVPLLMVEEKEKHTLEALMVSPASYSQVILGKTIAGLFYCLTAAAVVFVINYAMISQWWLAILAVICGALFTVAIGLLMGTLVEHQGTMNMWLGLILLILLLPVFLTQSMSPKLSGVIATLIPWLPTAAMAKVIRTSFSNSLPLNQVLLDMGRMLGFTLLLLSMVVWRVRRMDR